MGHGAPQSLVTHQQGSMKTGPRGRATKEPEVRRVFSPLLLCALSPPLCVANNSLVFNEIHYIFSRLAALKLLIHSHGIFSNST